jgi:hypothetical protein
VPGFAATPARDRFWSKVDRVPDGCWEWRNYRMPNGYGRFNRDLLAHRFAYTDAIGPIPDGLEVGHLCDNRGCVRPSHLEICTHRENFESGKRRGRIAKITWDDVYEMRASLASHTAMAKQFGINGEVVRRIRKNEKWPDDAYQVNPSHFPGRGTPGTPRKGRT